MPIGDNMRKLKAWKVVIEKFTKRLSDWKARSMSYGGQLILIKSVLNSLPLYFFSLFLAPASVINLIEKLRHKFFWGGSGSESKMSWVKWESILMSYGDGGLNIRSLKAKNRALVGKWWWRFRTESNTLWVNVIKSIYGREGGLSLHNQGASSSNNSVWDNIINLEKDLLNVVLDFNSFFERKLGDGRDTLFWNDIWVGGSWVCKLDDSGIYKAKVMTKKIDDILLAGQGFSEGTMRNKLIPQKVGLFIWRTLKHRIPVRMTLDKHGVDLDSVLRPLCNDHTELVDHAIFLCKHVAEVWSRVFNWWGSILSGNASLSYFFSEDGNNSKSKLQKLTWQAVRWVTGYHILKNRNHKVFHKDSWAAPKIVKVQMGKLVIHMTGVARVPFVSVTNCRNNIAPRRINRRIRIDHHVLRDEDEGGTSDVNHQGFSQDLTDRGLIPLYLGTLISSKSVNVLAYSFTSRKEKDVRVDIEDVKTYRPDERNRKGYSKAD
ncbi:uncharacterized protein [Rutidosis leptorrhynchoides]|uniref:uncharacterized protein n=1 Tax=Rutidosis leptorrhynchoides TaxID=125765 RepID=UPI003A999CE4